MGIIIINLDPEYEGLNVEWLVNYATNLRDVGLNPRLKPKRNGFSLWLRPRMIKDGRVQTQLGTGRGSALA